MEFDKNFFTKKNDAIFLVIERNEVDDFKIIAAFHHYENAKNILNGNRIITGPIRILDQKLPCFETPKPPFFYEL